MNKIYTFYSLIACLILSIGTANAYTFTWNGGTNTNWGNAANWTRTGSGSGNTIPGSADAVVVNNGSLTNQPELPGNVSVLTFTMSAGQLNLAGYTFTVINSANFTGGTVFNGWIDARDFTEIRNTTFDALGAAIVLNKTTGGSNNQAYGGNTFKGPCAILNSASERFRLSFTQPDIYDGLMHYEERGSGELEPAFHGVNIFPADISTSGSSNPVSFAMGNGVVVLNGTTTLHGNMSIINRLVVNTNSIYSLQASQTINNFRLLNGNMDLNGNTITVTGNAKILGGILEDGSVLALNFDTMQNAAINNLTLVKTGGSDNILRGGNTFGGEIVFRNNSANLLRLASVNGDDFNGNAYFLEMSSGALEPAYNGNNTFAGEVSTVGSNNVVTYGAGTGVVVIDGNVDQTLSGDAARTPIFRRLKMNTTANLFAGGINITIQVQLDFTKGIIASTNTNMTIFLDGAVAVNANDISYVAGPVRKIGDEAFTFPVGNNNYYAPIGISAPSDATHYFTAEYFNTPFSNLNVNGLNHVSNEEHWILDRNPGASSNVRVTLSYNIVRSGPINKRSDLRVARYDGADWVNVGLYDTTGIPSWGTITSNVVTSFSPFTLGSSSTLNPLPISLLNFNAIPLNSNVLVKWTTTNEVNNDFFTVEKSLDGRSWTELGVVDGAENSNLTLDYQLLDRNPVEGLQFYRLKQTDLNGEFTYSSIVPVKFNSELKTLVYPQPAGNIVNVSLQNNENQNVSITIYSTMGQKLIEMNQLNGNNFQVDISQLNTGVYYMEVNLEGVISKMKLIKQ